MYSKYTNVIYNINYDKAYKDVASAQQLDVTYISMVTISAAIATLGLLLNNTSVIIGAMIISPVMTPIMGGALSFAIGDYPLGRQAFRSILFGVILAVVFSAIITLISPIKDITNEIISRTSPNILDMIIALLSGFAGTLAIIFDNISSSIIGVAISVALMPPLCVIGIGIGTGQLRVALGGLFLFLTNLAAIFIASAVLFLVSGFYRYVFYHSRAKILLKYTVSLSLLLILSIPLFYTLRAAVNNKVIYGEIDNILGAGLNKQGYSRLASWQMNGNQIMATVDTLNYISSEKIDLISHQIQEATGHQYVLNIAQVPVFSLSQKGTQSISDVLLNIFSDNPSTKNPSGNSALQPVSDTWLKDKLSNLNKLFPYVAFYKINYDVNSDLKSIYVLLSNDYAVSLQEMNSIEAYFADSPNNTPIQVFVLSNNISLPPVYFDNESAGIGQVFQDRLTALGSFLRSQPQYDLLLNGYADSTGPRDLNEYISRKRAEAVKHFLVQVKVSPERISVEYFGVPTVNQAVELEKGRQNERRVDLKLTLRTSSP